jgi:hypothetical protein
VPTRAASEDGLAADFFPDRNDAGVEGVPTGLARGFEADFFPDRNGLAWSHGFAG